MLAMLALAGILCSVPSVLNAESEHGHDHKKLGGPKGGRLLENTSPRAEFFVEKDNTVTVTFYDDSMKPVAAMDQNVTVIADANGEKTQLEFEKKSSVLVSKGALPEVEDLNLVVQFRQSAEAKPLNFRFALEKGMCDVCKRAEYACICEH
jgi:hypothetical protein